MSRQPGQVRRAVAALGERTAHWVFVSSASVYADRTTIGDDESADLLPPLDGDVMETMETYGSAKVSCEQYVLDGVGPDRSLIARVSLIGGPGDWSGRTGYWPRRIARPSNPEGRVLVPDAPDVPVQVLDVRDLAALAGARAERGTARASPTPADPPTPSPSTSRRCATSPGSAESLEVVGEDWLAEHDVEPWMGPRSLPLWLPAEAIALNAHDLSRAASLGLRTRPLAETLADTLAWELAEPGERRAGLSDDDERELLDALDARTYSVAQPGPVHERRDGRDDGQQAADRDGGDGERVRHAMTLRAEAPRAEDQAQRPRDAGREQTARVVHVARTQSLREVDQLRRARRRRPRRGGSAPP